jgi:hypothetical protein
VVRGCCFARCFACSFGRRVSSTRRNLVEFLRDATLVLLLAFQALAVSRSTACNALLSRCTMDMHINQDAVKKPDRPWNWPSTNSKHIHPRNNAIQSNNREITHDRKCQL